MRDQLHQAVGRRREPGGGGVARRRLRASGFLLIVVALALAQAGSSAAQQFPSPPLYAMLPHNYPYPLIRVCDTPQGICAVPFATRPGQSCLCQRPDGYWVQGVCTR